MGERSAPWSAQRPPRRSAASWCGTAWCGSARSRRSAWRSCAARRPGASCWRTAASRICGTWRPRMRALRRAPCPRALLAEPLVRLAMACSHAQMAEGMPFPGLFSTGRACSVHCVIVLGIPVPSAGEHLCIVELAEPALVPENTATFSGCALWPRASSAKSLAIATAVFPGRVQTETWLVSQRWRWISASRSIICLQSRRSCSSQPTLDFSCLPAICHE